jgi:hypothetical protein
MAAGDGADDTAATMESAGATDTDSGTSAMAGLEEHVTDLKAAPDSLDNLAEVGESETTEAAEAPSLPPAPGTGPAPFVSD